MSNKLRGLAVLTAAVLSIVGLRVPALLEAQAPPQSLVRRYRIIDLGTLGGVYSKALAINNKGQVVGESLTAANADVHPFVWTAGAMSPIPGLAGNANASGRIEGINDNGTAVGTWDTGAAGDLGQLFVYDSSTGALSFPLPRASFAKHINNAGQILASRTPAQGGVANHVIVNSSGGVTDLDALFGAQFQAEEINALGFVIGLPGAAGAPPNSFIYKNGSFVSIFGAAGFLGVAFNDASNAAGFVREQTQFFGVRARAATLQANGTFRNYGSFNVFADATAVAVNNLDQVVGNERGSGVRFPFLIENGSMRNLNALLPAGSGWQLLEANDINDRGEVVGSGRINGEEHAFLLTPLVCSSLEDSDGNGNADNDGDGLCDSWEEDGVDGDGDGTVDLTLAGANLNRKDLYVEIDFMVSFAGGHGHRPRDEALTKVVDAFANLSILNPDLSFGVTLHLEVDDFVPEIEPITFLGQGPGPLDDFDDLKRGGLSYPCGAGATGSFGTAADRVNPNCTAILKAREMVYRYAVFGHNHVHDPGSSGIAEIGGNDFMVTLGGWSEDGIRHAGGSLDLNTAQIEVEAGTFMHEFGHTLGLRHGGDDGINCKPNYLSVMNYSFQGRDLVPNRPLTYSTRLNPTLDENALDESVGIQGLAGRLTVFGAPPSFSPALGNTNGPIDWNQDGQTDAGVSVDISTIRDNGCGAPAITFLTGFRDTTSLQYSFRHSPDFADGTTRSTVGSDSERTEAQSIAAAESIDFDGDGITNFPDNCSEVANPGQEDADGDAVGDACESTPPPPPPDTTPPALTMPAAITAQATSAAGAAVTYVATALDNVDGAVTPTCAPPSGSTFPLGTTTVTCTAADAAGNSAQASFGVTVQLGVPRIAGTLAGKGRDAGGNFYVDVRLTDTGAGHARNVRITQVAVRTLAGTGTVSLNTTLSPAMPALIGPLDAGASATVRFYVNVPATVTRFSITESGALANVVGTGYSYSVAQSVIP